MSGISRGEFSRRAMLAGIGSGTLLFTGCRCPRAGRAAVGWGEPPNVTPFLPGSYPSTDPPLALDVHVHLFNASDIDVEGFLAKSYAHSLDPAHSRLVKSFAPLIARLAHAFAWTCAEEMRRWMERLPEWRATAMTEGLQTLRQQIDAEIELHLNELADEMVRKLRGSEAARRLDEFDRRSDRRAGVFGEVAATTKLSSDEGRIRKLLAGEPARVHETMPSMQRTALGAIESLFAFAAFMLSPRHHNLRTYQKAFTLRTTGPTIDACFPALLDFDRWLGCTRTPSSIGDQILLHEQLSVLSGGYVVPIVAYNPWTDIASSQQSLELVKDAIENRGFVAVKLYPPMGYRPWGNEVPLNTSLERPDGEQLDQSLRALYEYCSDQDVPLMAHTAHSLGRDDAHDGLSDPASWRAVRERFPALRINAGHFGGNYHTDDGVYWPAEFAQLMNGASPGMFADLSYADELLDPESWDAERMRALLRANIGGGKHVWDRVMFGTDWLMISRLPQWRSYASAIDTFSRSVPGMPTEKRHAIFAGNAIEFFGLAVEQPNRRRLEAFHARWGVPRPGWLEKVDRLG